MRSTGRWLAVHTAAVGDSQTGAVAAPIMSDGINLAPSNVPFMSWPEPFDVYLKPTRDPQRKPSVAFGRSRSSLPAGSFCAPNLGSAAPYFRITSSSLEYFAVRIPLLKAGFRRLADGRSLHPCNLEWGRSSSSMELRDFVDPLTKALNEKQRRNHFPASFVHLGCKMGMEHCLRHGGVADIVSPRTWIFPHEAEALERALLDAPPTKFFIWKPARGSCGRGIRVTGGGAEHEGEWRPLMQRLRERIERAKHGDVACKDAQEHGLMYVVQGYVEDPLLIEGRKWDLRIYVAVTSVEPLVAYRHEQGLVRFAAVAHGDPRARLGGLTNYSVGRHYVHPNLNADEGRIIDTDDGAAPTATAQDPSIVLKWSFEQLNEHLRVDPRAPPMNEVWERVDDVIVRTLRAATPALVKSLQRRGESPSTTKYFELFGFDVLLDASYRPWLIEVNTLPSLESSSRMDYEVKSAVTTDLFNLIQIELLERPEAQRVRSSVRGLVHTVDRMLADHSDEGDIEARLRDEYDYKGGFRRIAGP